MSHVGSDDYSQRYVFHYTDEYGDRWFLSVNVPYHHTLSKTEHGTTRGISIDFTSVREVGTKRYFHFYYKDYHVAEMSVPEGIAEHLRKIPEAKGYPTK